MFTKAIVLSETEFRSLVVDFGEMMREEFADKYPEEITKKEMEEFLSGCFESLLDEYGVDEAMIFVKGKWREIDSGRLFVELVNEYHKGGLGAFARK